MDPDKSPEDNMYPIEELAANGHALRLVEFLYTLRDFEYKEPELAKCSNVPADKLDHAIRVLKDYNLIEVSGEKPNRLIRANSTDKGATDALYHMECLEFYLVNRAVDMKSIRDGYDNANRLV